MDTALPLERLGVRLALELMFRNASDLFKHMGQLPSYFQGGNVVSGGCRLQPYIHYGQENHYSQKNIRTIIIFVMKHGFMKNSPLLIALAAILLCVCSCKKEKNTSVDPPPVIDSPITYPNYAKLQPGNYWIYQDYQLDSVNGPAHPIGTFDSAFVEKDTVINGKTYHKYWDVGYRSPGSGSNSTLISFLRDSLSYLVTPSSYILFSSADFSSIFFTSTGRDHSSGDSVMVTTQMGFKDAMTVTDAGTFKTSSFRQVYHFLTGPEQGRSVEYDYRYGLNIGMVSYTTGVYSSMPQVYERRLVRYHVQ